MLAVTLLLFTILSSAGALNALKPSDANSNKCFRTAGYWGQNSVSYMFPGDKDNWEKPLAEYCNDDWDIIMLAFLHVYQDGNPPLPGLNFAYHCETAPNTAYPKLLECPDIAKNVKTCQANGKIILLSLGGATSTSVLATDSDGVAFADTLWNMFLGGSDPNIPRPFEDVILDGIDLDIEGGSSTGYGALVTRLRELYEEDKSKTYYVTGAPQCVYPDNYLGPGDGKVLTTAWLDYIFVQFYNNWCGINNYANKEAFNFQQWNAWAAESKTQVLLGVPGSDQSGRGYLPADQVVAILKSLAEQYEWFGGYMAWDVGTATANENFASTIADFLHGISSGCPETTVSPPALIDGGSDSSESITSTGSIDTTVEATTSMIENNEASTSSMGTSSSSEVLIGWPSATATSVTGALPSSSSSSPLSIMNPSTTLSSSSSSSSSIQLSLPSSSLDTMPSPTESGIADTQPPQSDPAIIATNGFVFPNFPTNIAPDQPRSTPCTCVDNTIENNEEETDEGHSDQGYQNLKIFQKRSESENSSCVCHATSGYLTTKVYRFGFKPCGNEQLTFGFIMRGCIAHRDGYCSWGKETRFCFKRH